MNKIKLGDVLEVKRGMSLPGEYYATEGDYIRLTLGNFNYPSCGWKKNVLKDNLFFTGNVRDEYILKKGDIITPLTEQVRGLLGNTATIPEDALYIQSGDIGLIIPDETKLDKRFSYYLVSSSVVKKQLDARSQQTKIRHTSPEAIKDCVAFIPIIKEQKKISYLLDCINKKIENNNAINDNLVSTLQIIYKKMFLESQNTYITKPLADLCSKIGSGATPKGGKAAYFDKGISLIRSMNVFDYFFSYPELAHISQIQANALANVEIQQADVLFNITGVSVTRCCVVPDDVLPARVNQHVMIIRPYEGKNMSYYIMCTLCTSENKAKLLGIGQSGSTREAINKQELERFEIPVPSDEELERFGEIATKIYALIFSNTNEIRMLCDMKDTLLTKLSSY